MPRKDRGRGGGRSEGLVLRSIRNHPESSEQVIAFLQQFGEVRFGVSHFEELDADQKHSWIKFSTAVAADFSQLTALVRVVIEEERDADLRLLEAETIDIVERRKADERREAKGQKRREAREDEERRQATKRFELEVADEEQRLAERAERHAQDLSDRVTGRRITVFSILLSAFLIIFGVVSGELIFVGSSWVSAVIAITGFAKFFLRWGSRDSL